MSVYARLDSYLVQLLYLEDNEGTYEGIMGCSYEMTSLLLFLESHLMGGD